jgi:hypothetical protein
MDETPSRVFEVGDALTISLPRQPVAVGFKAIGFKANGKIRPREVDAIPADGELRRRREEAVLAKEPGSFDFEDGFGWARAHDPQEVLHAFGDARQLGGAALQCSDGGESVPPGGVERVLEWSFVEHRRKIEDRSCPRCTRQTIYLYAISRSQVGGPMHLHGSRCSPNMTRS